MKRLQAAVVAEKKRRLVEYDREFGRRLDTLSQADQKALNLGWNDLSYQAEQADSRAERIRRKVLLLSRTFERRWRPFSGTEEDPFWQEESQLVMLMNQYTDDPDCLALIPPVGRYLLHKYPTSKYLGSQLELTSKSVERKLADLDRTRAAWKARANAPEVEAAPAVRALFRRLGASTE